jgi:hypothetical protein
MPGEQSTGYLPGDPRYGLQGEAAEAYRASCGRRKTLVAVWPVSLLVMSQILEKKMQA